jgi:hypothetical protein
VSPDSERQEPAGAENPSRRRWLTRQERPAGTENSNLAGPGAIGLLGAGLLLFGIALTVLMVELWPAVEQGPTGQGASAQAESEEVSFLGLVSFSVSADSALLLLVIIASALGSYVHAATSFTDFVGNRRLERSWIWWYILRVTIGVALAIIFYFAIRGGLFAADTDTEAVNPFGVAAVAGLVGLFSKQATDKLREVFDTLFRVAPGEGDAKRTGSLTHPKPIVVGIEPTRIVAGSDTALVQLRGEGFVPDSQVRVARVRPEGTVLLQRRTAFVSATELTVELLADDLAEAGSFEVTVFNPEPGGGTSGVRKLEVELP